MTEQWKDYGISHLLAISGLHMGLVGMSLFVLLRCFLMVICGGRGLTQSRRLAAMATMAGMWLFCFWVSAPVSAIRACAMASVVLGAIVLNRMQNGFNALGFAALVILFADPPSILGLGTWLSFGCTWFLILASTRPKRQRSWYQSWLMMAVVPWLATLPVCALCFGELYGWSVPANLIAVLIAAWVVTPAALFSALLSFLELEIPDWLDLVLCLGVESIQTWLGFLGSVHHGYWQVSLATAWALAWVVWPALIAWLKGGVRSGLFFLGIGLGAALVGHGVRALTYEPAFELYVPYVGHGDAMVLGLPNGQTMLVDAGGASFQSRFDPGQYVIAPLLRKLGTTHIDYVVISHPDHDHIGGLDYLLERFSVGEIWVDGVFLEHPRLQKKLKQVADQGAVVRAFQTLPNTFRLGTTRFDLIYPRESHGVGKGQSTNQRSLVFRVEDATKSVLFTGDLDTKMENLILADLEPTQLLKVAHHGSVTSSSSDFLDRVKPCLAVVSSGRFGQGLFPHPSVVRRFQDRDIPLLQTSTRGALVFRAEPSGWQVNSALGHAQNIKCLVNEPNRPSGRLD